MKIVNALVTYADRLPKMWQDARVRRSIAAALFGFCLTLPAFLVLVAAASPVFAQAAGSVPLVLASVDFTPLANNVINFATVVLTVAAGVVSSFAVKLFASKTKIHDAQFETLAAQRVNDILLRAIDAASTQAKVWVADPNNPLKEVTFNNFFIETAVRYAQNSMPDLIAYFKLTPERIADMIRARMAPYLASPQPDSGVVQPVDAVQQISASQG